MGEGHEIKCKNCGNEYAVTTGIGIAFPIVYEETVERIRDGEYGEELKDLFLSKPYLAVNCENDLFVCDCGHWVTEENLDIYEPIEEELKRKRESAGAIHGYVMWEDLKEDYKLIRHHVHVCPECGKEMKRIKRPDYYVRTYGLKCPECGTKNKAGYETRILWD